MFGKMLQAAQEQSIMTPPSLRRSSPPSFLPSFFSSARYLRYGFLHGFLLFFFSRLHFVTSVFDFYIHHWSGFKSLIFPFVIGFISVVSISLRYLRCSLFIDCRIFFVLPLIISTLVFLWVECSIFSCLCL